MLIIYLYKLNISSVRSSFLCLSSQWFSYKLTFLNSIGHVSPKTLNKEFLERSAELHFTAWLGSLASLTTVLAAESIFHQKPKY